MAKGHFEAKKNVCTFCGTRADETEIRRFGHRLYLCRRCAIRNEYRWEIGISNKGNPKLRVWGKGSKMSINPRYKTLGEKVIAHKEQRYHKMVRKLAFRMWEYELNKTGRRWPYEPFEKAADECLMFTFREQPHIHWATDAFNFYRLKYADEERDAPKLDIQKIMNPLTNPIYRTSKGWYWGGRGPFSTREKAVQVARAAYASGYKGSSRNPTYKVGDRVLVTLAGKTFSAWIVRISTTKDYFIRYHVRAVTEPIGGRAYKVSLGQIESLANPIGLYQQFHGNPPSNVRKVNLLVPKKGQRLVKIGRLRRIEYDPEYPSKHVGIRFYHLAGDIGSKMVKAPILATDSEGKGLYIIPEVKGFPKFSSRGILG